MKISMWQMESTDYIFHQESLLLGFDLHYITQEYGILSQQGIR